MPHSFVAYIDESGDDGLNGRYRIAGQSGGSSHWLTISASVWRLSRDLEAVAWRDEIRTQLPSNSRGKALHCKSLTHEQKVMAANVIATKPIRSICIMANKPVIPAGIYEGRNQFYFYMSRYLLERVSWLCRDLRPRVPEGDGRVKIIFSRRGGLQYQDFRKYMSRLKDRGDNEIQINWPVIDIDSIEALDHDRRAGLQIADIVASCMSAGLEPNLYGGCERRYAEILRPVLYQKNGNFLSYGVKLVPRIENIPLTSEQRSFIDLFRK
jgi:hypothetical protein